jgi:hypothetical protein
LKGLLTNARKANKIEMDGFYDWSIKATTNTLNLDMPTNPFEKFEKTKTKEEKYEHVKNKKEVAMNEALNEFKLSGGGLLKNGQISQSGTRK